MSAPTSPVPPSSCDVLVVGAGPAGSACARVLAQAGHGVLLVDQHDFPRDKVCGDGLIPDAHAALRRLGLHDAVMSRARWSRHVRCVGPKGRFVDVPGSLAVLPRRELDHLLMLGAQAAGARVWTPARFEGVLQDGDRVVGARLRSGETVREVSARWVVLATGAAPQALQAADMLERRTPSGVALRGYVRHPDLATSMDRLEVVWHPRLSGGYGWIFPAPDGVFNVGAGIVGSHRLDHDGRAQKHDMNLRELLQAFCEVHPVARELVQGGQWLGEVKGAPLRCSLAGARWSRPGLLVTGEAAGSTYAFTGEGIGKALETGMLAADVLRGASRDDAVVCAGFDAALQALRPRFVLYERAQRVNAHPWLADFIIWRARRSPRLLRRMTGVLEETSNPGHLLTVKGVLRLFTE